jgi:FtsP/CotA-like multicopper oxidase with cupredoxin domain
MLTRRTWLKSAVLGGGLLYGAGSRASAQIDDDEDFRPPASPAVTPFQRRLPIPRQHLPLNRPGATAAERARAQAIYQQTLAEGRFQHAPVSPDGNADYYEVMARPGTASIIPGLPTTIWGYNGLYPGATFMAKRERTIVMRHVNRLPEILSLHQHGGHTPPDSDGTPMLSFSNTDTFAPGALVGSRTYVYPNDNEFPGTLWYHDHGHDVTGANVYSGLAGFFLLGPGDGAADEAFRAVDAALPSGYGRYDIPMVFQDRQFNADGSLYYNSFNHDGILCDRFLVNGAIQPYLPVARRKYRFRWLNGSNARHYELFLSTGDTFTQIATEGALLPHPVERSSIRITPAERMEVVIDFSRYPVGSKVYLVNCLQQTNGAKPDPEDINMDFCTPLVEFRVHRDEDDPSSIPYELNPAVSAYIHQYLNPANPVNPGVPIPVRNWELVRNNGAWQINFKFFDPDRVDVVEKLNTQSIWRLHNSSGGWSHPIHIHDMEFVMLDRNGVPPAPGEAGLKDVFSVGPNEVVRVMAYWSGPKNVGRYVFHCHNLEHEDMKMMGQFEVVP